MPTEDAAKMISCKLLGVTLCLSTVCFFLHLCWMYRPTGSGGSVILLSQWSSLAVTCKWSNLHPVLIHVFLLYVQWCHVFVSSPQFCEHVEWETSYMERCCSQHLFIFYSIIYLPCHLSAISSSVRFIHAFTEPSWFL